MDRGVVYAAMGSDYIEEVEQSVDSLRDHLPNIPITVFSDRHFTSSKINNVIVVDEPNYDYEDSIIPLDDIPYDRILQLDSDTYITGEVSDLFELLDEFDFGATINPGKRFYEPNENTYVPEGIPESFPLYNSGVMVFRNNEKVKELFTNWTSIYRNSKSENEIGFNQPALREALYKSNVRLATLPREYNCHTVKPGCICGEVKIVHCRHPDIKEIANKLNQTTKPRCYNNSSYPIDITIGNPYNKTSIYFKFRMSMRKNGFTTTLKLGFDKIKRLARRKTSFI